MTSNTAMADNTTDGKPPFSEHRVPRGHTDAYGMIVNLPQAVETAGY
jgi:hypothetical protein